VGSPETAIASTHRHRLRHCAAKRGDDDAKYGAVAEPKYYLLRRCAITQCESGFARDEASSLLRTTG
jgi:hypothetical protein